MKTWQWVIGASVVAATTFLVRPAFQRSTDGYYTTSRSISNARMVMFACIAYREHPQSGGKYPASLDDLLQPPFGGRTPLEFPDQDIKDGWGNRLRYAVTFNEKGEQEAFAWSERVVREKTYLCGAKCTFEGQVVVFGLPE